MSVYRCLSKQSGTSAQAREEDRASAYRLVHQCTNASRSCERPKRARGTNRRPYLGFSRIHKAPLSRTRCIHQTEARAWQIFLTSSNVFRTRVTSRELINGIVSGPRLLESRTASYHVASKIRRALPEPKAILRVPVTRGSLVRHDRGPEGLEQRVWILLLSCPIASRVHVCVCASGGWSRGSRSARSSGRGRCALGGIAFRLAALLS